jgi:GT2 family glycosyltransferase
MKPVVSVVIVSREKMASLSKTIESLANQSFPKSKFEVIIVDDGSEKEDLSLLAKKFKKNFHSIKVVRQEKLGLAAGRNLGVKSANSEIIAFTDNDCLPEKNWLANLVSKFGKPEIAGVEGKIITDYPRKLFTSAPENIAGGLFTGANTAYKKEIIEKAGYYDEKMGFWREDSEFAFRAMKFGKIVFANDAIVYHPLRKDSMSNSFRYLFFLRNDFFCILRHPEKSFFILANLAKEFFKSLLAISFFAASIYVYLLFDLVYMLAFFFIGMLAWLSIFYFLLISSGKYDSGFSKFSEASNPALFFLISFAKYIAFPIFFFWGFFDAVALIISRGLFCK